MLIVYIEWVDSSSQGRNMWNDVNVVLSGARDNSMKCRSIGFILFEDDDSILLVAHLSGDCEVKMSGHCGGDIQIPKCAITKRVDLKLPGGE